MSLTQSPKPGQHRAALYKQSPARSPLRVMMKARCQERIRAGRDAVVGNRRNLGQVQMQLLMQEELQSLSNFNGYLGFTQAEVDEALAGFEEMEKELMEEWRQALLPDEEPEEELLGAALVCPVCMRGRLHQVSESQVTCLRKDCELTLDGVVGGPEALGGQLEAAVDNHSHSCSQALNFAPGPDACLLACCDACQFFHAVAGR